MPSVVSRLKHAWNAFAVLDQPAQFTAQNIGSGYGRPPSRTRPRYVSQKSIVSAIYTRMAIDAAAIPIKHVRLDKNGQFKEQIYSAMNDCLTVEANIDQAATHFRQDLIQTLFDEGVAVVVPTDTTFNPLVTGGWDITSMRVGKVLEWYPQKVKVRVYNQDVKVGMQKDIVLDKSMVAIIENPLYSVMNEQSSTLQRLLRKLSLLDAVDEQSASGQLDIIIQLPYVIKTESKREEAKKRAEDIQLQLKNSQYGVAYTDGTEKITQLNRPATNNLMDQINYLTAMLYGQLGINEDVMNGKATADMMVGYYSRTIEPILTAIVEAMIRSFLTKTARSQGQSVQFYRNPFQLVPVAELAEMADKFRRNEVLTGNEMRGIIGFFPSSDPNADKLDNPNLPLQKADPGMAAQNPNPPTSGSAKLSTVTALPDSTQNADVGGQPVSQGD